jgi:hypothetical protein
MNVVKAPAPVVDLFREVTEKHHFPRLETAQIGICFTDAKAFRGDQINLGKVSKFTSQNRIWQDVKRDFCITLCSDVWYQILNDEQREALADLLLTCCDVEYEPVTEVVGNRKKPVKDEWGRVQKTDEIKYDDEGNPKWRVKPLDLIVFAENARKYDLWLKEVIEGLEPLTVQNDEPEPEQ